MPLLQLALFLISFQFHTFLYEANFNSQQVPRPIYQDGLPICGPVSFLSAYRFITKKDMNLGKVMTMVMTPDLSGACAVDMVKGFNRVNLQTCVRLVPRAKVRQTIIELLDKYTLVLPVVHYPKSKGGHWFIIYKHDFKSVYVADSNKGYCKVPFGRFMFDWVRPNCVLIGLRKP